MEALVHFAVGVCAALIVLSALDRPARREFLYMFSSGFWAMFPDGHWLLWELGFDTVAAPWQKLHQSAYADLFWFHRTIDSLETGRSILEIGIALVILLVLVLGFYRYNDWSVA